MKGSTEMVFNLLLLPPEDSFVARPSYARSPFQLPHCVVPQYLLCGRSFQPVEALGLIAVGLGPRAAKARGPGRGRALKQGRVRTVSLF